MVEEIIPNIYKIAIPLPNNPLKSLNSYFIRGKERCLLIDTGFNREECLKALLEGLSRIGADLDNTDFFVTHMHADHSGLITSVAGKDSVVLCSQIDSQLIKLALLPSYWSELYSIVGSHGFPLEELTAAIERHPGNRYNTGKEPTFKIVKEGDKLEIGSYLFTFVETPGHTPGHMCLYENKYKILFSGDHILDDITPNIAIEKFTSNPLGEYLKSLEKINNMDISITLPGHRKIIDNVRQRISELKTHHEKRNNEILNILDDNNKALNAYQIASKMTWDLSYPSWEQFPVPQKWFATVETISHLEYLHKKNILVKINIEGISHYKKN